MRILALDPSFRNCGYTVWDTENDTLLDAGVLKTSNTEFKAEHRLVSMQDLSCIMKTITGVKELIEKYKIKKVVAELPTGGSKSAKAAKSMSFCYGFVAGPIVFMGVDFKTVTPQAVKKFVYRTASGGKDGIMDFVTEKLNLETTGNKLTKWHICDKVFGKGDFEHIADSVVVYLATKE